MRRSFFVALPGLCVLLALAGCINTEHQDQLACIGDANCPPRCVCNDLLCEREDGSRELPCGGTCDSLTECPEGTSCQQTDDLNPLSHACAPPIGAGGTGGQGGSGGSGGSGGTVSSGACPWDRSSMSSEIRVHVGNNSDVAGVQVSLSAGGLTCEIEDEERVLQLPVHGTVFPEDRMTVMMGDTFGGLGQALMPLGLGDTVSITATYMGSMNTQTCTVAESAFEGPSKAVFAEVFAMQPPTITCTQGFEGAL